MNGSQKRQLLSSMGESMAPKELSNVVRVVILSLYFQYISSFTRAVDRP